MKSFESFLSVERSSRSFAASRGYFADLRVLGDSHAVDLEVVHADGHPDPSISRLVAPWPGGGVPSAIGVVRT